MTAWVTRTDIRTVLAFYIEERSNYENTRTLIGCARGAIRNQSSSNLRMMSFRRVSLRRKVAAQAFVPASATKYTCFLLGTLLVFFVDIRQTLPVKSLIVS